MANASVPVTANINIKVPEDLKLQLRRYTRTLIYSNKYDIANASFFMYRIVKSSTV